jgi:lysophospholipase L1-like esterase
MSTSFQKNCSGSIKLTIDHIRPSKHPFRKFIKRFISNIFVLIVGLIVACIFGEILVRVVFNKSIDLDMEMWKYATQGKVLQNDPKIVFQHRPNFKAHLMGTFVSINRFGLRDDDTSLEKPHNVYRIITLGDSLTMGWGVHQDQIYPAGLEQILNAAPPKIFPHDLRYEVLNLGIGNYNTVQEVSLLRKLGLQFKPDLIILGYFINDAEPMPNPQSGFLIQSSYLYAFLASRIKLLTAENLEFLNYYRSLYQEDQAGWNAAKSAMMELVNIGKENNIPVALFIIPELHNLSDSYPFADIHKKIASYGEQIGLPVIDLFPEFKNFHPEEDLWVSPKDAHPNAQAHRVIAQGMYNALPNYLIHSKIISSP